MQHAKYVPIKHLGPGEWVGQCLRRLARANEDRPVLVTDASTDWRFDWKSHAQTRHQHREFRFE